MALKIGIGGNSRSGGGASSADKVSYDNTTSGLQSTNVQDAIDEVGANLGEIDNRVNALVDVAELANVQAENVGYNATNVGAELDKKNALLSTFFDIEQREESGDIDRITDITSRSIGFFTIYGTIRDTYTNYEYFQKIEVNEGETITALNASGSIVNIRCVCAYDANDAVVSTKGVDGEKTNYLVPSGVKYIVVTCTRSYNARQLRAYKQGEPILYDAYIPKEKTIAPNMMANSFGFQYAKNDGYLRSVGDISDGGQIVLDNGGLYDIKTNKKLHFHCDFSTFGSIEIGHGKTEQGSTTNRIVINSASVYVQTGTADNPTKNREYPHELTISNYLDVTIVVGSGGDVTILLESMGATTTITSTMWYGCMGGIYARSIIGNYTNCILSWTCDGWKKPIHIYGDSYLSNLDSARWAFYLRIPFDFINNCLLDGYAGKASASAYTSLLSNLSKCTEKPRYILWTMGMNNADTTTAINASFKDCVDKIISLCDENGIIPIFCTIPNVPSRIHTFKNAYIKSLGVRYVDFAKAVNAESAGATWYDGMLSSDNVHPTELGANALYSRVLADFPEIMQK